MPTKKFWNGTAWVTKFVTSGAAANPLEAPPAGPQGLKGDKGDTGPKGEDSTVAGPTGPQGPTGPKGEDSTVAGPTGPQGLKGDKGDKGDTGAAAPKISVTAPLEVADQSDGSQKISMATSPAAAGTYPKVTTDASGRVVAGANLVEADIPTLSQSKVTGLSTDLAPLLAPTGMKSPWGNNDVAIYLSAGQSNDLGYGATLPTAEQITTALANVKVLKTGLHKNLSFSSVTWEGYTSLGECNLGGSNTDHLSCAATEFARLWQSHITAGNSLGLPDLYVIRMSTAGQGMFPGTGIDAWSFTRDKSDVNSLFPRYMKTLRLAIASLRASGKNPRIIVQNWNQWEAEADASANNGTTLFGKEYAAAHFNRLIQSIRDATGCPELKFDFYYPLATTYPSANMLAVRKALESVVSADPQHFGFNDVRKASHYTGVSPSFGIFQSDNVHYTATTHKWFAAQQFARITNGDKGVPAGLWPHGTRPLATIEEDVTTAVNAIKTPTSWQAKNFAVGTNIETQPGLSFDVNPGAYSFDVQRASGRKSIKATKVLGGGGTYGFMRSTAFISDSLNGELVVGVQSGIYPGWLGAAFRVSNQGIVDGGFNGVPFSYIACNFGAETSGVLTNFNVWVLWNATLDVARDRLLNVPVSSFATALPTVRHLLRIRLVGTTIFLQSSIDEGITWVNHLTDTNLPSGAAGKTITFGSGLSSLTNIQTNGGLAGFIMGLGTDNTLTTGVLDGFEFNPLS